MNRAMIVLGSNLNPETHIQKAKDLISKTHKVLKWSAFEKTPAIGDPTQSDFLNGIVLIETSWTQEKLRVWLKEIEDQEGRNRQQKFPVSLDLDLILWNNKMRSHTVYKKNFLKAFLHHLPNKPDLSANLHPERVKKKQV